MSEKEKPGPKPEILQIDDAWENAVKRAMKKPPPPQKESDTAAPKKKKPPQTERP